jgi:aminoglycoside phosphotransferase (APT) family kinase protein
MQEMNVPEELKWARSLAGKHPDLFGGQDGGTLKLDEPQASSHATRVYGINGGGIHIKYFGRALGRTNVTYEPRHEMETEYRTLREFEKNGFSSGRYRIVRPLGFNEKLDCALATVYVGGETLLSLIYGAINGEKRESDLLNALDMTAGLLKRIHTAMPQSSRADGAGMFYSYLKSVFYLEEQGMMDGFHRRVMRGMSRWYNHRPLFEQPGVTVHGDANPSNFKIDGDVIYGFDVERSHQDGSPLLDLGTMAAELKHHFSYLTGKADNASPYVERFLEAYAPDDEGQKHLAGMLPFFESRGFFKIAMLGYWKRDYKKYLVELGTRRIEEKP